MSAYKNVSRNIYYKDYTFISDANSLPRSAVLGLNRSQQTYSTRVRKILLANKSSLNNAIETLNNTSDNIISKSYPSNILCYSSSLNELPLIKKPFKHYKQSSNSTKSINRSISVTSNEKKQTDSSSINSLKTSTQTNVNVKLFLFLLFAF